MRQCFDHCRINNFGLVFENTILIKRTFAFFNFYLEYGVSLLYSCMSSHNSLIAAPCGRMAEYTHCILSWQDTTVLMDVFFPGHKGQLWAHSILKNKLGFAIRRSNLCFIRSVCKCFFPGFIRDEYNWFVWQMQRFSGTIYSHLAFLAFISRI